ncbi:4-hydroxybenzoate polyprenyltransferase [Mariprofundus ferrinatatus]|uniref:4-hydroxybenzoate octaprenyltransferase n=1 Tax=Mariprofundus ferrinatatus TaxID=1921087 RepID=A0A2K8L9U1_9PROT|nr:4-hydroxybenzoate octaprenyltransferase [Mariprofundus ferrinatatus]ATX82671.1 4-hydroxybenzoate polyprenyltransferase [Mariprofundus ferrinatatus]
MQFLPVGSISDWYRLLRIDRPVGYWLLLWPTMWGLFAGAQELPSFKNLFIFVAGVFLMRSAGCVINDFADREFDPHVERTKQRPVAAGNIAPGAALAGFILMMLTALLLVSLTSPYVIALSVVGAVLAGLYPFLKRYTHFPQAWLGMAFGWGAVMAWASETGSVFDSPVPWLLFFANVCWSLSYDTAYAMGDRADDVKIGVKSTAIWFGERAVVAVVLLGMATMLLLVMAASLVDGFWVAAGWGAAMVLQVMLCARLMREGEPWGFPFFLNSHWVGALFAFGLIQQGLFG